MEKIDINAEKSGFQLDHKPTKDGSFENRSNPMFSQTFLGVVYLCTKKNGGRN
jgi:hypothetical protein